MSVWGGAGGALKKCLGGVGDFFFEREIKIDLGVRGGADCGYYSYY